MDIGSLLLGFALLLGVAFAVVRPLIEKQGLKEKRLGAVEALAAQRDMLLNALRDLDFDHATGKIADEDYAPQRARLAAEGAAVLKQLDTLRVTPRAEDKAGPAVHARRQAPANVDDPVEAAVAARRRSPVVESIVCHHCSASAQTADKFCPRCGAAAQAVSAACPECGRAVRPDDKFCAGCGAKLIAVEAAE